MLSIGEYKERASEWVRINSASELSMLLDNVREYNRHPFQFSANPPCHNSASRESFRFGDAPQGLIVDCWECKGGNTMIERVETNLHIALNALNPSTGKLRYPDKGNQTSEERRQERVQWERAKMLRDMRQLQGEEPEYPMLSCVNRGDVYTLGQLYDESIWIVGEGKKPATWRTASGGLQGYRQSHPTLGIKAVKEGGDVPYKDKDGDKEYILEVMPWATYKEAQDNALLLKDYNDKARVQLCLGGDNQSPCAVDVALIDIDYKASDGDDIERADAFRDVIKELLMGLGLPVFISNSGKGFHALYRVPQSDYQSYKGSKLAGVVLDDDKVKETVKMDLFLPSAKFLAAFNPLRGAMDYPASTPIPLIDFQTLNNTLMIKAKTITDNRLSPQPTASETPQESSHVPQERGYIINQGDNTALSQTRAGIKEFDDKWIVWRNQLFQPDNRDKLARLPEGEFKDWLRSEWKRLSIFTNKGETV